LAINDDGGNHNNENQKKQTHGKRDGWHRRRTYRVSFRCPGASCQNRAFPIYHAVQQIHGQSVYQGSGQHLRLCPGHNLTAHEEAAAVRSGGEQEGRPFLLLLRQSGRTNAIYRRD